MSLNRLIPGIAASERTLTVFNPMPGVIRRPAEHFADRNASMVSTSSGEGPSNYAVLGTGNEFRTTVSVGDLLAHSGDVGPRFEHDSYTPILDHLDGTLFISYDRQQMLDATREIKDRVWRVGTSELHSGFQPGGNLRPQFKTYRRLGGRNDLSVHVHTYPNGGVPQADQFQLHLTRPGEIRRSWFVACDGNDAGDYKCTLVVEETEPGFDFTGFWTYDPPTIGYIASHLVSSYSIIESDDPSDDADDGYQLTT